MLLHLKIKRRTHRCQAGTTSGTTSPQSLPCAKGYTWHDMCWTTTLYMWHSPALDLCRVTATWTSNHQRNRGLPLTSCNFNRHPDFSKPRFVVTCPPPHAFLSTFQSYYKMFQPKKLRKYFSPKIMCKQQHDFGAGDPPKGRDELVVKPWDRESADQDFSSPGSVSFDSPHGPCMVHAGSVSPSGNPVQ